MSDEERIDSWPSLNEAVGVIRAYEQASRFSSSDAQIHFDFGSAFMELGTGLEIRAIKAFEPCPLGGYGAGGNAND